MEKIITANLAGIEVRYPESLAPDELTDDVLAIKQEYADAGKKLLRIEFSIDDEGYLVVQPYNKSPITRLRRITGYLSSTDNFNDAKRAEERDRLPHTK